MNEVQELESEIRKLINLPRKHALLRESAAVFGMCCSALDVIGDTELALEAYMAADSPMERQDLHSVGSLYITIYGILQVLYVQQDAVKNLAKSLRLPYKHSDAIREVREVRNAAVGHPTLQNHATPHAFNHISRITMCQDGFQMLTHRADGSSGSSQVNVPELIGQQRTEVTMALHGMLNALREEEMAHRKQFRDNKLASLFPSTLGYTHEKIGEAIPQPDMRDFGAGMLDSVAECAGQLAAALKERGVEDSGFISHHLGEIEHAIARLRGYFTRHDSGLSPEDARIFHFFLCAKMKGLAQIAAEIDDDYTKDV